MTPTGSRSTSTCRAISKSTVDSGRRCTRTKTIRSTTRFFGLFFKKFDESEFLIEVSNIAYKLSTMSWCLDKVGGTFESRLKEAEKNSIVDETELVKIRTLESISNTIHRNLSIFIGKLETNQRVLNSARLKNIKINITISISCSYLI